MTQGTRDVSIDELTMRVNTGASVLTLYFNKGPVMVSITGTTVFELFIINTQMSSESESESERYLFDPYK